jgi:hypothetical protein
VSISLKSHALLSELGMQLTNVFAFGHSFTHTALANGPKLNETSGTFKLFAAWFTALDASVTA